MNSYIVMIVLFLLGITSASAAGMTKLLVATGDPTFEAQKTEVIDISDPDNICDSLGDYPLEAASGFGGMLNGMPVSCGGFNPDIDGYALKDCYKLEEGAWVPFATLEFGRWYLGSVAVVVDNSRIWAAGGTGYSGYNVLQNTEYINADGSVDQGPELPYHIDEHCGVNLNSTHSMLLLGENYDTGDSGTTYFFNHQTNQFTEGPRMNRGRYRFACGMFQKNGRDTIMVAGGYAGNGGYPFDSVEYMYLDELVWQEGPNLPGEFAEFSLISSPTKDSLYTIFHTSIYRTQGESWEELEQKLEVRRDDYVAMFIPDDLVSCRKRT